MADGGFLNLPPEVCTVNVWPAWIDEDRPEIWSVSLAVAIYWSETTGATLKMHLMSGWAGKEAHGMSYPCLAKS